MTQADYLPSAEVCARLGIDRSTLSRWVAAGKITPAIQAPGIRGPFLFHRDDVEELALRLARAS